MRSPFSVPVETMNFLGIGFDSLVLSKVPPSRWEGASIERDNAQADPIEVSLDPMQEQSVSPSASSALSRSACGDNANYVVDSARPERRFPIELPPPRALVLCAPFHVQMSQNLSAARRRAHETINFAKAPRCAAATFASFSTQLKRRKSAASAMPRTALKGGKKKQN